MTYDKSRFLKKKNLKRVFLYLEYFDILTTDQMFSGQRFAILAMFSSYVQKNVSSKNIQRNSSIKSLPCRDLLLRFYELMQNEHFNGPKI